MAKTWRPITWEELDKLLKEIEDTPRPKRKDFILFRYCEGVRKWVRHSSNNPAQQCLLPTCLSCREIDKGMIEYGNKLRNQFKLNNIMEEYNKLLALVVESEADFKKFYDKGNAAAGTRVRKAMMEIKNKAQEIRVNVSEVKNG
jgi:hypothetical protein